MLIVRFTGLHTGKEDDWVSHLSTDAGIPRTSCEKAPWTGGATGEGEGDEHWPACP